MRGVKAGWRVRRCMFKHCSNVPIHDTHTLAHIMCLTFNKTLRFAFPVITKQTDRVGVSEQSVVIKQEDEYRHTKQELI